jgi:hypothetical protein
MQGSRRLLDFYGYFEIDTDCTYLLFAWFSVGNHPHHFPSLSFSHLGFNFGCLSLSLGREGLAPKKMGLAS